MDSKRAEVDFYDLYLAGTVIFGDTTGDPGIPYGLKYLAPYVSVLEVTVNGSNITQYISEEWYQTFCRKLVESLE